MINSTKWVKTLPANNDKSINQKDYDSNPGKWLETINSNKSNNLTKKYFLITTFFVIGLILVSIVKNQTRNLQKEIDNLYVSINTIKFDLHQTKLDHEFITSPENISRLAEEHLNINFTNYKKSQIKEFNVKEINLVNLEKSKYKKIQEKVKIKLTKKIETKKEELKKLQELYNEPKNIPDEMRVKITKTIK